MANASTWSAPASAQLSAASSLLCGPEGCAAAISEAKWNGRAAYKLSDGKSEVLIVPSLGRVMSYGLVGGPNLLYADTKAKPDPKNPQSWVNYGGDKTWPGPQNEWGLWQASGGWPPPREWDGAAHEAEVITGGKLRTTSGVHPRMGARTVRTYEINAQGELVIEQAIEKLSGAPLSLSVWSVTQIVQPDAIFLAANSDSPYKNGFHWISREAGADKKPKAFDVSLLGTDLIQLRPSLNGSFKIGVDAPVAHLASVKDGVAFVQKAPRPEGDYPNGALNAGFPLEIWNNAGPAYNELEVLSPRRNYFASKDGKSVGTRFTHTVRWSLVKLPSPTLNDESIAAVRRALGMS
jgi:hypothetical protein